MTDFDQQIVEKFKVRKPELDEIVKNYLSNGSHTGHLIKVPTERFEIGDFCIYDVIRKRFTEIHFLFSTLPTYIIKLQ